MTTRLLVLAGGQSEEHAVSLNSARCVLAALQKVDALQPEVRVITRGGRLLDATASARALEQQQPVLTGGDDLGALVAAARACDVVLPLLHGPLGEDGTVQGLLTLLGVPYVGCGVLGSSLCMDKPMAKEVLRANHVPQVPYIALTRHALNERPQALVDRVTETLRAPWFVKPANMGSSVGISRAETPQALHAALALAARYDRRIIVEEGLNAVRELEVGIIGNDVITVSPVGEICHDGAFYDYATKYTAGHSHMVIPAQVPEAVAHKVAQLARDTYRLLDCAGLARIDFFYTPHDEAVYVNEVNTLPGFTNFSMFPSLLAAAGLPYGALIERLVQLAQERHAPQGA